MDEKKALSTTGGILALILLIWLIIRHYGDN